FQVTRLATEHGLERCACSSRIATYELHLRNRKAQLALGVVSMRSAQQLQSTIEVPALNHVVGDAEACRRAVAVLGEQVAQQKLRGQDLAPRCMLLCARQARIARPSGSLVARVHCSVNCHAAATRSCAGVPGSTNILCDTCERSIGGSCRSRTCDQRI